MSEPSDTRGWKNSKRKSMYKEIDGRHYELRESEPGGLWYVMRMPNEIPAYTLADAKRAAHKNARERG